MTPEIGQFALSLALVLALIQSVLPMMGARVAIRSDAKRQLNSTWASLVCRHRVRGIDAILYRQRLYRCKCGREFKLSTADAVKGWRNMGQP